MVRMQNAGYRELEKRGAEEHTLIHYIHPEVRIESVPFWVRKGSRATVVEALREYVGRSKGALASYCRLYLPCVLAKWWFVHCPRAGVNVTKVLRPRLCDVAVLLLLRLIS